MSARPAAVGLLTALAFLVLGGWVLGRTHPADDAYIVFRYARHLAAGQGITYNPGGPPVEGATDFLWLLLVSGPVALGLDPARAALLWNALGAGLAAVLLVRVLPMHGPAAALGWIAPAAVVTSNAAVAACAGFSSLLYAALCVLLVHLLRAGGGRGLLALPYLGLAVALFRPDGVIVGVPSALLGLLIARERGLAPVYLRNLLVCGAAGVAYFAARCAYFGLPLPLPLYVKRYAAPSWLPPEWLPGLLRELLAALPGAHPTGRWLRSAQGPLPPLVAIVCMAFALGRTGRAQLGRLALAGAPSVALVGALVFALQSQNVAYRFQAPLFLVLVYALACCTGWLCQPGRSARACAAAALGALLALAPSVRAGSQQIAALLEPSDTAYLHILGPWLGARLTAQQVLALTEAGLLGYWTEARVVDLTGLNDPRSALAPASLAYVRELDPDVVMFHHAFTLDGRRLTPPGGGRVVRLAGRELAGAVRPRYRRLFERGAASYAEARTTSVRTAALALARYLTEHAERYELWAVDYRGRGDYEHVWAVRRELPLAIDFAAALERAANGEGYASYLDDLNVDRFTESGTRSGG